MISGRAYTPPESFLLNELMEEIFVFYKEMCKVLHPIVLAAEMHERSFAFIDLLMETGEQHL